MRKHVVFLFTLLLLILVLTGCSDLTSYERVIDELEQKYEVKFKLVKENKAYESEGTVLQEGIIKSEEGIYVSYQYDLGDSKLVYEDYLENLETNNFTDIADGLLKEGTSLKSDDYAISVYTKGDSLEGVIFLNEGVTLTTDDMKALVDNYKEPKLTLYTYSLSSAGFASFKKDLQVRGNFKKDTSRQYLHVSETVYPSPEVENS